MSEVALVRPDGIPAGVRLCAFNALPDPGARNFVLRLGERHFHGFFVRRGSRVIGFVDRCPHLGLPLAKTLDAYLTPDAAWIGCDWHGALFDPETGACVAGPCAGASLTSWPVEVLDGQVVTA